MLTSLVLARHPGLFQRAVLLDPVLFTPAMIGVMAFSEVLGLHRRTTMAKRARARRNHWVDRPAAFAALHGRGIFKGWTDAALGAYVEHALKDVDGGVELKCRPSREAEIFSSCPKRLWPSLTRIVTPTRIFHGQASYPSSPARWRGSAPSTPRRRPGGGGRALLHAGVPRRRRRARGRFPPAAMSDAARERVWLALSGLWLDTQRDEADLRVIADTLRASALPPAELEAIYLYEVAPVVWLNAWSVAGSGSASIPNGSSSIAGLTGRDVPAAGSAGAAGYCAGR